MALVSFIPAKKALVGDGKYLRGSLWVRNDDPTYGILGVELSGCLIRRRPDGTLHFSPPLERTNFGTGGWRRKGNVTPDLAQLVTRMVEESDYGQMLKRPLVSVEPQELGGSWDENREEGDVSLLPKVNLIL